MPEKPESFDSWCVVELFGHKRIAGRVTEQQIGSTSFVRVDVPETPESIGYTKFYGAGAIYAMTPTSEAAVRLNAQQIERYREPVPYIPAPKQLAAAGPSGEDDDNLRFIDVDNEDDDDPEDDGPLRF